jgi:hypothetical protein
LVGKTVEGVDVFLFEQVIEVVNGEMVEGVYGGPQLKNLEHVEMALQLGDSGSAEIGLLESILALHLVAQYS